MIPLQCRVPVGATVAGHRRVCGQSRDRKTYLIVELSSVTVREYVCGYVANYYHTTLPRRQVSVTKLLTMDDERGVEAAGARAPANLN